MQHQEGCPLAAVSGYEAAARQGGVAFVGAEAAGFPESVDAPCPDRRCSTWYDLRTWFGYQHRYLPALDFHKCFADIAHGGDGTYERLAVLGEKALEMMCTIYISEKFSPLALPFELQRGFPPDMIRYIWTLKRVDRCCSLRALSAFARTYLSTAQSFGTSLAAARYLKALLGYAVQSHSLMRTATANTRKIEIAASSAQPPPGNGLDDLLNPKRTDATVINPEDAIDAVTGLIYDWATILIDHIYDVQKLKLTHDEVENELIQDLQDYFGYPYDTVIPRIRNVINAPDTYLTQGDMDAQAQTGREIITLQATEFLLAVAQNSNLDKSVLERWLRMEVNILVRSKVIAIFAATWFNLIPILNYVYPPERRPRTPPSPGDSPANSPPSNIDDADAITDHGATLNRIERLFLQLLAASYTVTRESETKRYLPALIQRLRQLQLILHMEELDIKMSGPLRTPLSLFQGIDVYRWSTISNWAHHNRYALWARHPRSTNLEAFLPVSDPTVRRKVRQMEYASNAANQPQDVVSQFCNTIFGGKPPRKGADPEQASRVLATRVPPVTDEHGTLVDPASGVVYDGGTDSRYRRDVNGNVIPCYAKGQGTPSDYMVHRFATNKKTRKQPPLWARLFRRNNEPQPPPGSGYRMWKPPFAMFMRPRMVEFEKGEAYVSPVHRRQVTAQTQAARKRKDLTVTWGDVGSQQPVGSHKPLHVVDVPSPRHRHATVDSSSEESAAASIPSGSSTCSSCSSCRDETPHDCKGWNSVLKEMQTHVKGKETMTQNVDPDYRLVYEKDRATEDAKVAFFRAGLQDKRTSGAPADGIIGGGSARIDRLRRLGADDSVIQKILEFDFSHDKDGHKKLTVEGPPGMRFAPRPQHEQRPNTVDFHAP